MKTILIVEDQPDVQRLLGIALRAEDRKILHCLDAEEAWALVQNEHPDVVLLDIMMPGNMDGMDLLRLIRGEQAYDKVSIIVISARTQEWDKAAILAAGADGFVAKPFRLDELKNLLQGFLSPEQP
jgi:two-component system phosphate regulon response regulator PhoB